MAINRTESLHLSFMLEQQLRTPDLESPVICNENTGELSQVTRAWYNEKAKALFIDLDETGNPSVRVDYFFRQYALAVDLFNRSFQKEVWH